MRGFPLFHIKYTPRSRCKLHKLAKEKLLANERAALDHQLALERAAAEEEDEDEDDDEESESMLY